MTQNDLFMVCSDNPNKKIKVYDFMVGRAEIEEKLKLNPDCQCKLYRIVFDSRKARKMDYVECISPKDEI